MQEVRLAIFVVLVTGGFSLPLDFEKKLTKNNSGHFEDHIQLQPEIRLATVDSRYHWPGAIMYYTIDPSYTPTEVGYIKEAMNEINANTCVEFIERTNEKNYVRIESVRGKGCKSPKGMRGGAQSLKLEKGACFYPKSAKGHAIHELLHALGFHHQHNAEDRDNYITVIENNIRPDKLSNYEKVPESIASDFGLGYDYNSIMHYKNVTFAIDKTKPSIIPKNDPSIPIGQREGLSKLDIDKVNHLYGC